MRDDVRLSCANKQSQRNNQVDNSDSHVTNTVMSWIETVKVFDPLVSGAWDTIHDKYLYQWWVGYNESHKKYTCAYLRNVKPITKGYDIVWGGESDENDESQRCQVFGRPNIENRFAFCCGQFKRNAHTLADILNLIPHKKYVSLSKIIEEFNREVIEKQVLINTLQEIEPIINTLLNSTEYKNKKVKYGGK